jgi:signal transduction histidine kinase
MNRERRMPSQWIDPSTSQSLAVLVESVIAPLLIQHASPVCLELDIDTRLEVPADSGKTVELLRTLVGQSLREMPDGGDLYVSACRTPTGIEVELSDTGPDVSRREKRLPLAAAAIGASLTWRNCPQGGGSVTIKFRPKQGLRRAAA